MTIRISASLAGAPLDNLRGLLKQLEHARVDYIHFDVEDGSFVPVMTLGTKIIHDLRPLTSLPFDVHLMMYNPEWLIPSLVRGGADRIAVNFEACPYPRRTLRKIAELGATPGLAFNPATPLPPLDFLADYLAYVILLSTEPEEPDCPFLPAVLNKLFDAKANSAIQQIEWVVDGGLNADNLGEVVRAGVDVVVIGRAVFLDGMVVQNIEKLRRASSSPAK
ncbi:MAG TPA: hypothetical protein VLA49_21845 [Anaerolineales bacterium]|nr:hypothetical protein [Anaerolineales bacterium]